MFRSLLASWPLFFGLLLIMIGNGLMLLVLGIRAENAGFSSVISGVMMGGYFLGFFGGSAIVPRFLVAVGHIRTFGALSAIASAAVLLHLLETDPVLWTALRFFTGFSWPTCIVVESWLNENQIMRSEARRWPSIRLSLRWGLAAADLGGLDNGVSILPFLFASVLVSLVAVPILPTAARAQNFQPDPVPVRRLYRISPLALIGMLLQGMTTSMAFGLGAIYATTVGLTSQQASIFLSAFTIGNSCQYPLGRLSDYFDRRVTSRHCRSCRNRPSVRR